MTRPRPTSPWTAMRGVLDLSLSGMLWNRRSLTMGGLIGLPVLFALAQRLFRAAEVQVSTGSLELYGQLVLYYYVQNVLPLVALFYASALVAEEVESKTLTFLLTRPITRASVLGGKFAAYLVTTHALVLPALVLSFALLATTRGLGAAGQALPALLRDGGVLSLTLVVYGGLFSLPGVLMRRPLIPGLLLLFAWEPVANLPGYLPRFTVTAYLRSLLPYRAPPDGASKLVALLGPYPTFSTVLSLTVLALVALASLGAAVWIFSRREYLLEQ